MLGVCAALTFRDYGLGWDDYTHSEYGDLLLAYYGSGFTDKRALSFVNLYMYGGGFDLLSALAAKVLPFGAFETRRLIGAMVGIIGLAVAWRLARRLGGPLAGLLALVLLATTPMFYGHMFMNAKDGPFAVAMCVLLLAILRAIEDYPTPSRGTVIFLGLALGLVVGTRILGGIAVLFVIAPLALLVGHDIAEHGARAALRSLRLVRPRHVGGTAARLSGHGPAVAVVGDRAPQSRPGDRLFLALLREALARAL